MGVKGRTMPAGEERREAILAYLKAFQKEHKYLPTPSQVARELGCRVFTVQHHLSVLRDQKKVAYEDGAMSRSLRLR